LTAIQEHTGEEQNYGETDRNSSKVTHRDAQEKSIFSVMRPTQAYDCS
jgi:hypothetical protein